MTLCDNAVSFLGVTLIDDHWGDFSYCFGVTLIDSWGYFDQIFSFK